MKVIDFHTHIFPEKIAKGTLDFLKQKCETEPSTNGMAEGLRQSTVNAGIDLSIILPVATKPEQFHSINRFAMQFRGEDHLLSFGSIHPDTGNYKEELKFLKDNGFKGIKIHPDYQQVFIDDIRFKRIIGYASELGMIVSTHAGWDPGYKELTHCTPERVVNMLDDVRPEKMILAHMGGFKFWDEVEKELCGAPVWFDTGVVFGEIQEEQFLRIARRHGTDRILFATDSPWGDQKEYVETMQRLPFSTEEKERIFHRNAEQLLEIQIPDKM